MPIFQVTAPDGRTATVEGAEPPGDADMEGIFGASPAPKARIADMEGLFAGVDQMDKWLGSEASQLNLAVQGQTDPKAMKMRAANTAFLASVYEKDPGEVSQFYDRISADYAQRVLGATEPLDDAGLYARLGAHVKQEKAQDGMMSELAGALFEAARTNQPFMKTFDAFTAQAKTGEGYVAGRDDYYREFARQQWAFYRTNAIRLSEPIAKVSAHMANVRSSPDFYSTEEAQTEREEVLNLLSALPAEDAEMVMDFAAGANLQKEGDDQTGGIKKAGVRAARGVAALSDAVQGFSARAQARAADFRENPSVAGLARTVAGAAPGMFGAFGAAGAEGEQEAAVRTRLQIERGLNARYNTEVDPLKGATWLTNGMLDAAESFPRMMVSLNPVGLALNLTATQEEMRGQFEDRGVPPDQAQLMSGMAAVPYVALDFVSAKMAFKGKLPGLERFLTAPTVSAGRLAARAGVVAGAQAVEQFVQETAQDLIAPAAQQIAGFLSESVPDVEWSKELGGIADSAPETLGALLPFILIGTGTASFKDRAYGREYFQNRTALKAVGLPDPVIEEVLEATTPEQAGSIIQQNWDKRESGAEQKSAVREMNRQAMQAREEMGNGFTEQGKAIVAKHPDAKWEQANPGAVPIEVMRNGKPTAAFVTGYVEFIPGEPQMAAGAVWVPNAKNPITGTIGGWSHTWFRDTADIITPLPSAAEWAQGMREVASTQVPQIEQQPQQQAPAQQLDFEYLGQREAVMEGIGPKVDQWQVRAPGDARGRTMTAEQMKAEGITPPVLPATAEAPVQPVAQKVPDVGYVVTDKATGAVLGTSPTPEGAAQIVQDVKREATENRSPTSTKNAIVDEERKKRGMPAAMDAAKRSMGTVWDEAARAIDAKPDAASDLVRDLQENPRAVTDLENALLLRRQIELQNRYDKQAAEVIRLQETKAGKEQLDAAMLEVAKTSDDLLALYDVDKLVGTETGRGLAARRMMANEDFTLAKMVTRRRVANEGRPLTPEQQAEVADLHKRLEDTQREFDEYRARQAEVQAGKAAKARKPGKGKPPGTVMQFISKQAAEARTRIAERLKEGRAQSGLDPTDLFDHAIVGAEYVARGVKKFADWSAAMTKEFGERLIPHLAEIKDRADDIVKLQNMEARATSRITELERQIRNQEVFAKLPSDLTSPELEAKRAKIAELNEVRENIRQLLQPQPDRVARVQLEEWEKRAKQIDREIEKIEKQIADQAPFTPTRQQREEAPENAERLARLEALKEERQNLRDTIQAKSYDARELMTDAEKEAARLDREIERISQQIEDRAPFAKTKGKAKESPENADKRRLLDVLKERRENIRQELQAADKESPEAIRLKAFKTRVENASKELERRIAQNDFSEAPPPTELELDDRARELQARLDLLKIEYQRKLEQDQYNRLSKLGKAARNAMNAYDAGRNIMTTGELSFILRQGLPMVLAHPILAAQALPDTFRALASNPTLAHAVNLRVLNHPDAAAARAAKLHLTSEESSLSKQEETMIGRWTNRVPIVKNFNQAATVFLNRIRFDSWQALRQAAGPVNPKTDKDLAKFVNEATGRGTLPGLEKSAVFLGRLLFAPRFLTSRFQYLTGNSFWQAGGQAKKVIAKDYAKSLIGLGVYYGLLYAGLSGLAGDDEEQQPTIGTDPRSADFGKVTFGNYRIDPLGGFSQALVFTTRTALQAARGVAPEGTEIPNAFATADGREREFTGSDVLRFGRSKLHPLPGAIVNLASGKDLGFEEATLLNQTQNLLMPITYADIYEAMRQEDVDDATALTLLALMGVGLQNLAPEEERP